VEAEERLRARTAEDLDHTVQEMWEVFDADLVTHTGCQGICYSNVVRNGSSKRNMI
jgi:hypothetical protein